jgi:hypothetical protein|tara:strand:+ start:528 stop:716 length:189 start_codon:yes stop_codon:yes gene_type:complete
MDKNCKSIWSLCQKILSIVKSICRISGFWQVEGRIMKSKKNMSKKRKNYSSAFKAKLVLELL